MASKPASNYNLNGQQASRKQRLYSMASKPASNYDPYGQKASLKLRR